MYKWYQWADICYTYLSDIPTAHTNSTLLGPGKIKWFTRRWTLQELIAPRSVEFYAADWTEIGTKFSLREEISLLTGIDVKVLAGESPGRCNVAERLSWAASRETTWIEDAAYCLLGLFQVHMPLVYGEGESALTRLQEQILKTSDDYTLLAGVTKDPARQPPWDNLFPRDHFNGALALHLEEFRIPKASKWRYSDLSLDRLGY